jgi:hypothetical protein
MGLQEIEPETHLSSRYLAELCAIDDCGHNLHFLFEQRQKGEVRMRIIEEESETAKTIQWVIPEPDVYNSTGGGGKI